jgi:Ni/Fe-hydrogenase subunit HybB-like protein
MATTTVSEKPRSITSNAVVGGLALLALAGFVTLIYRLSIGLGPTTNLSDYYPWGLWIGFDFTLIAFSGGAFSLVLIVHMFNLKRFLPVLRLAVLTGWLGYISVAVILIADLGRWDRFWHFLVYPNIHSPMFEISWCLFLYSGVLTLEIAPIFFEKFRKPNIANTFHKLVIPLAFIGVILSLLHQSTLGTLYVAMPDRIHPLWYTPLMPVLFLISAIGLGLSGVILAALIAGWVFHRPVKMKVLEGLAYGVLWIWVVYLAFKLEHLIFSGLIDNLFSFGRVSFWFLVEFALMVIVPIGLLSVARFRSNRFWLFVATLSAVIGTTLNRFNVTFTAQSVGGIWTMEVLADKATYWPSWIEMLIQAGVLAAAVLAWYLAIRYLPILPEKAQSRSS